MAAWTRVLARAPGEGVELSVWLTRAGWAAALWPTPVDVLLGRAALGGGDLAPPAVPDARGRGPWRAASLPLAREAGGGGGATLGAAAAASRARAEKRASEAGGGGAGVAPPPPTSGERRGPPLPGDDATDIELPPLDAVLHGNRGFVVVEWRVSTPPRAPPPWFEAEVPVARLRRAAHTYAHGGFTALAPSMMADPGWRAILRAEDPASAARAAPLVAAVPPRAGAPAAARLMTCLENSPVLCAYGMVRCGCTERGGGRARGRDARGRDADRGPSVDGTPSRGTTPAPRSLDGGGGPLSPGPASRGPTADGGARAAATAVPAPLALLLRRSRGASPDLAFESESDAGGGAASPPPRAAAWRPRAASPSPPGPPPLSLPPPLHARIGAPALAPRSPFTAVGLPPALGRRRASRPFLPRPPSNASFASADESDTGRGFLDSGAALVRVLSEALFSDAREPGAGGADAASSSSSSDDDDDDADAGGGARGGAPPARKDSSGDDGGEWPAAAAHAVRARLASHEASGLDALRAAALAATPAAVLAERWGAPNRYGYTPPALEWDVWIDPAAPHDLGGASLDHGTPGALVAQALTATIPGLGALARHAGASRILREGISPAAWLNRFGRSVNAAACGDPRTPLPVVAGAGAPGFSYRLNARVSAGRGAMFGGSRGLSSRSASRVYVRLSVRGSSPLPRVRGPGGAARGAGAAGGERVAWLGPALSLWPLAPPLAGAVLRVEVRASSVVGGRLRDARLGAAEVPLSAALVVRPGDPPPESAWVRVEPRKKGGKPAAPAPAAPDPGPGADALAGCEAEAAGPLRRRGGSAAPGAPFSEDDDDGRLPSAAGGGEVRVWLALEEVAHLDAMAEAGVERAAATTCLALLSRPGGLFLDVKSAYSTSADVQLFAGALAGLGVHVKAVASFRARQLDPPPAASRPVPCLRFFHGLSGLELACERGRVPRGALVLFNGASLVLPHAASRRGRAAAADPATRPAAAGGALASDGGLLDPVAVRRYVALVEAHGFLAGVYVQESDACAAAVDTIVRAVSEAGALMPLGFAYGGVPGAAAAALAAAGRGFGGQALVDELGAGRALSARAARRVARGDAAGASLTTAIALAHRLLRGTPVLSTYHQRLLLRLLWDVWPPDRLASAVRALGGAPALVGRFWAHYEATTTLTMLELGFNRNHTKDLLRLLRDRGVLASLATADKIALAAWLTGPDLYGWGLTYVLMVRGVRAGWHKFAKEGIACLLESCTAAEADAVLSSLGGRRSLMRGLRGNVPLSVAYARRVEAVEAVHRADPAALAVDGGCAGAPPSRYAALPHRRRDAAPPPWDAPGVDPCHTRDKTVATRAVRLARKLLVLATALAREALLALATGGLWPALVSLPRALAPYFSSALGTSVAVSVALLSALAAAALAAGWAAGGWVWATGRGGGGG